MIDIADFAVGLSRQLYGLTMVSERPRHRMYEQWHPLGPIGIITAFNFPIAVWAWNAMIAAVCGDTMLWKPSSKTPLTAIAVQHICNRVMQAHKVEGVFNLVIGSGHNLGGAVPNHSPRVDKKKNCPRFHRASPPRLPLGDDRRSTRRKNPDGPADRRS